MMIQPGKKLIPPEDRNIRKRGPMYDMLSSLVSSPEPKKKKNRWRWILLPIPKGIIEILMIAVQPRRHRLLPLPTNICRRR